jgi:hypothetical protein
MYTILLTKLKLSKNFVESDAIIEGANKRFWEHVKSLKYNFFLDKI